MTEKGESIKTKKENSQQILTHDIFNLLALAFFVVGDVYYLHEATDLSKFGTKLMGADHVPLFAFVMKSFALYLVVDMIWIILVPKSVQAQPWILIVHHLVCLSFMVLAFLDTRWSWHAMVILTAEINTFFLTIRRNVSRVGAIYTIANFMFYLTWFIVRIGIWTALAFYFCYEFEFVSQELGTYYNFWILGPILQVSWIMAYEYKVNADNIFFALK